MGTGPSVGADIALTELIRRPQPPPVLVEARTAAGQVVVARLVAVPAAETDEQAADQVKPTPRPG
jgi:hypothetical protein